MAHHQIRATNNATVDTAAAISTNKENINSAHVAGGRKVYVIYKFAFSVFLASAKLLGTAKTKVL